MDAKLALGAPNLCRGGGLNSRVPIQAIERIGRKVRIVVSDMLRPADVFFIRDALALGQGRDSVLVDVRGATECPPSVLMALLDLLIRLTVPYEFVGLSDRHRLVLSLAGRRSTFDPASSPGEG